MVQAAAQAQAVVAAAKSRGDGLVSKKFRVPRRSSRDANRIILTNDMLAFMYCRYQ